MRQIPHSIIIYSNSLPQSLHRRVGCSTPTTTSQPPKATFPSRTSLLNCSLDRSGKPYIISALDLLPHTGQIFITDLHAVLVDNHDKESALTVRSTRACKRAITYYLLYLPEYRAINEGTNVGLSLMQWPK